MLTGARETRKDREAKGKKTGLSHLCRKKRRDWVMKRDGMDLILLLLPRRASLATNGSRHVIYGMACTSIHVLV